MSEFLCIFYKIYNKNSTLNCNDLKLLMKVKSEIFFIEKITILSFK